jgi:AP-3 complex subunit delta
MQLLMFGYEMSWASFNVIEVMSSPKFSHKRLAYLVAAQAFAPDTDVLMLATNLIKKVRCALRRTHRERNRQRLSNMHSPCLYVHTCVRVSLSLSFFSSVCGWQDLNAGNHLEASVALTGLATFVNTDLARDLSADIVGMLNHSKPYIRKRVRTPARRGREKEREGCLWSGEAHSRR